MTNNHKVHFCRKSGLLYLIPVAIAVFGTLFYPFLSSIVMSFTNKIFQHQDYRYIGLSNYLELFCDPVFWLAFRNSMKLTLLVIIGDLLLGFPIALLLNHGGKYTSFFRVILFIPWLVPSTVTATIFKWIFNSYSGYFNYFLLKIGVIHKPLDILSNPKKVWWALAITIIWGSFPFVTFVLSAALKSINQELYSVAKLDGASSFQLFRYITLPCIRSSIITIIVMEVIWEMSDYDMVKLMTNGGPGKTTYTLSLFMYDQAFYAKRIGYSGAIGVIFFIAVFLFTIWYLNTTQQKESKV